MAGVLSKRAQSWIRLSSYACVPIGVICVFTFEPPRNDNIPQHIQDAPHIFTPIQQRGRALADYFLGLPPAPPPERKPAERSSRPAVTPQLKSDRTPANDRVAKGLTGTLSERTAAWWR